MAWKREILGGVFAFVFSIIWFFFTLLAFWEIFVFGSYEVEGEVTAPFIDFAFLSFPILEILGAYTVIVLASRFFHFGFADFSQAMWSIFKLWFVSALVLLVLILVVEFMYIRTFEIEHREELEFCRSPKDAITTTAYIGYAFECAFLELYKFVVPFLILIFLVLPINPILLFMAYVLRIAIQSR